MQQAEAELSSTRDEATGETRERPHGEHLRHWRMSRDAEGIAWLELDRAETDTNTLSEEVLEELDEALGRIEADRPKALVIRSAKPNGFIAGADVREFVGLEDADAVKPKVRRGQAILDRLAGLAVPTVAVIHGFCLGGGLELALACRHRIARDDARLGFPEVRLGIHPGFGGTLRLTRLLPAHQAMDLMLTGRTVSAKAAKRLGLVDVVTQERHLDVATREAALGGLKARRGGLLVKLSNTMPARPLLGRTMRRRVRAKARPEHYPAPYALIDLWVAHGGRRRRLLDQEAASVARLITGNTAQNLVRVFLLRERLKALGGEADAAVHRVHVVGAGTMGGDIAAWCALQGLQVTLQDREAKYVAPAIERAAGLFEKQLRDRRLVRAAQDRLVPDLDGEGVPRADLVIEAVPEDLELKRKIYRGIEPRLRSDALLATNTSSLPLEDLAEALARPERLVGLHFFNPVARMPLIEVVRSDGTDAQSLARAQAFARRIDRLPVPVKSAPGFLVNRALMPYLLEAVHLLDEGMAPATIDAAAEDFGMPMGPIELADRVGLDVCLSVGDVLAREFGMAIPDRLRRLVEEGHTGRKSGRGFYAYEKGRPQKGEARASAEPDLQDRLVLPMLNTCAACLREGVVDDADLLDGALVFGTGFAPFRGGPVHYARSLGREPLMRRLDDLAARHGERFRADPGWELVFERQQAA